MHLQLWLLLHCHKHTSTPQTSSAAFSAEVAVGVERAAAVGSGASKVAAAPPAAARVFPRKLQDLLLQGAQPGATPSGCSARRSPELAAAPASPRSCPQRSPKFLASGPPRPRSAEPSGLQKGGWVGPSGLLATPSADAAPTSGV